MRIEVSSIGTCPVHVPFTLYVVILCMQKYRINYLIIIEAGFVPSFLAHVDCVMPSSYEYL